MKIGLIVPGGVDPGGEERVVPCLLWLMRRLVREHEVHVFALRQPGAPARYRLEGAAVHVANGPMAGLRTATGLLTEHGRGRFDVLHGIWGLPQGYLAVRAGRLLRVPSVVHLFGGELVAIPEKYYGDQRSPKSRQRLAYTLQRANRVTAQSQYMVDAAASLGTTPMRLPMGVGLDEWPPGKPRRRIPGQPARLLSVGTINPIKDHDTLIGAAARLAEGGLDFILDIVGEDLSGGRMARRVREDGLDTRVRFHGFLPHARLRPIVDAADLLVHAARHEAGPIVMLEAAVAGVPTVSTAVGHAAEWAPDAAIAVPPGEPDALARAIREALDDDVGRLRMAELARARAIAENADWTADRLTGLYRELAAT